MKRFMKISVVFSILFLTASAILTGCGGGGGGGSSSSDSAGVLNVEEVDPGEVPGGGTGGGSGAGSSADNGQDIPSSSDDGFSPIFQGKLGVPISPYSIGIIDPDPTGLNPCTDYDGDGISNDYEITSNPLVADYPRVVTRISAPITMEIRVSETSSSENYSETLDETDIKDMREQSMDENHYTQANLKTTPVVVKESLSTNTITSSSYSLGCVLKKDSEYTNQEFGIDVDTSSTNYHPQGYQYTTGNNIDISKSASSDFSTSTSSEYTDFPEEVYTDNLDHSGSSLNQDSVQSISKNYKTSAVSSSTFTVGPNAGIVRASLFIKNTTVNIPVRVSNILCTLTFKTPAGEFLPVKTFRLRNEDWSEYEQDIYGDEEFGPFTIEIENLNTNEVKNALKNGYMPQIHIVSYELSRVEDSNYNPGVDNLKIVEETAKGRTALIKIVGEGIREMYRVPAFDVDEFDHSISPGISLKKALFNIFKDRIGMGEQWGDLDQNEQELTVQDANLRWMPDAPDSAEHTYSLSNTDGNSWSMFETYVKKYKDENNVEHRIETIKRIGDLTKYNPFDVVDNPSYNPNELLTKDEFFKMKYWIIYHNGRYFEGDINDPIWVGERYEIICIDIGDFNTHFETFSYTPLQSQSTIMLSTLWNALTNQNQFNRALYLGTAVKGDAIHLELDLSDNRMLFDPAVSQAGLGFGEPYQEFTDTDAYGLDQGYAWFNFNYTFGSDEENTQGIPQEFSHKAYGRTNSIVVEIVESKNALEYDINIYDESTFNKTVRVSSSELERNGGIVAINRHTEDINGDPVGLISEGTYSVDVTARGIVYGVPVTKESSANNDGDNDHDDGEVYADVTDPTGPEPGGFTYTVSSMTNMLTFQISEASNAEYFLIRYIGPQNYASASNDVTIRAHNGYNRIDIANPSSDPVDPGVYEVHVYSVINGDETLTSCKQSGTGEYILVNYERYGQEKSLVPKLSTDFFDQRAVDLEVNFNDGSGWYRLRLASGQEGDNDRTINCMNTNYMEYNKQKFHIYFQPPAGDKYCLYNVFSGGRDEVDVYIRTVAKPEYRYTVWPKQNPSVCNYIEDAERYVYTNAASTDEFPGGDVLEYWMENQDTDSSNYEDMMEDKTYSSMDDLTAVGEGDFGIVPDGNADSQDCFFSPALYRKYSIIARIEDKINDEAATGGFIPGFKLVTGGDSSLIVSGFTSIYGVSYEIFFRAGERESDNPDFNASPWHSLDPLVTDPTEVRKIGNLIPNALYTVAVVAYTENGDSSEPAFKTATTRTNAPPPAPVGIYADAGSDGHSIVVYNIYVHGVDDYRVEWRAVGDSAWNSVFLENQWGPVTYNITGLDTWHEYEIRVQAYTYPYFSEYSDSVFVDLRTNAGFYAEAMWDDFVGETYCKDITIKYNTTNYTRSLEFDSWEGSIVLDNITLPEGTVDFQVNGTVEYDKYVLSNYHWVTTSPYPFAYTSTWNIDQTINFGPTDWILAGTKVPILLNQQIAEVFTGGYCTWGFSYGLPEPDTRNYLFWNANVDFTITARDYQGSTIQYTGNLVVPPPDLSEVMITEVIAPDEYEPDDTYGYSNFLTIGQSQVHTIHTGTDVDWIQVNYTEGYTYVFETFDATGHSNNVGTTFIGLYGRLAEEVCEQVCDESYPFNCTEECHIEYQYKILAESNNSEGSYSTIIYSIPDNLSYSVLYIYAMPYNQTYTGYYTITVYVIQGL